MLLFVRGPWWGREHNLAVSLVSWALGQAGDRGILHFKASQFAVFIFTLDLGGHLLFFSLLEKSLKLSWIEKVTLWLNDSCEKWGILIQVVTAIDSYREESVTLLSFRKTSFSKGSFRWLQRCCWQKAHCHCWLVRNTQAVCPSVVTYVMFCKHFGLS